MLEIVPTPFRRPAVTRRPRRSTRSDDGSLSAFVALVFLALLVLMGLVVDGGSAFTAHQAAVDEAEQAARAGAGALSVDALLIGVPPARSAGRSGGRRGVHRRCRAPRVGFGVGRCSDGGHPLPGGHGPARSGRHHVPPGVCRGVRRRCSRRDRRVAVTMPTGSGRTVRIGPMWASLSLGGLLLIVVGVPIALVQAGGLPLAHLDAGQVVRTVTSHRSLDAHTVTDWVARGALLFAWVSWAWMSVCVVVEMPIVVHGPRSGATAGEPDLPVGGGMPGGHGTGHLGGTGGVGLPTSAARGRGDDHPGAGRSAGDRRSGVVAGDRAWPKHLRGDRHVAPGRHRARYRANRPVRPPGAGIGRRSEDRGAPRGGPAGDAVVDRHRPPGGSGPLEGAGRTELRHPTERRRSADR